MDITSRIKAVREARGIKQADLARMLDLDRSHYHRFENRGNKLTIEQLERIATALGVSASELLSSTSELMPSEVGNEQLKECRTQVSNLQNEISALVSLASGLQKTLSMAASELFYITAHQEGIGEDYTPAQWQKVWESIFEKHLWITDVYRFKAISEDAWLDLFESWWARQPNPFTSDPFTYG